MKCCAGEAPRAVADWGEAARAKGVHLAASALLGLALGLATPASVDANTGVTSQNLGGFSLSGAGTGFLTAHSLPKQTNHDMTLELWIGGDLGWSYETVELVIDGTHSITLFDNVADSDYGYADYAGPDCAPQRITLTLPQAKIAPLIADGSLQFAFTIDNSIQPVCGGSPNEFALVVSGELTFNVDGSTTSPAQEQTAVAASMTQSRSSVTIASLPSLSGRAGGGGATGGGGFSGGGGSSGGSFTFSGDIASLRRRAAAQDAARRFAELGRQDGQTASLDAQRAALEGAPPEADPSAAEAAAPFDVWFGGSFSYFDVELGGVGQTGGVGTLQMGVDTRISDRILMGVAVFGDLLQSDVSNGSRSSGLGVMAGPYAVVELDYGLYLELLAAYGSAFNRIESDGLRDARFQSLRQLYTGRLSGEWGLGGWLFRPSSRVTYYAERQESFDVGDGTIAPADASETGQLRFGPEIVYQHFWDGGALLPYFGAEGVWAFKQPAQAVNGVVTTGEEMTGSVSFGFDARLGDMSIRAGGRLDGVGEPKLDLLTGEITVRAPLP